ncbi:phosphogluconate dehydratase [Gammaproteobacteria bacterium]|nr:phosphogluconate dehydratase [Gammaproteobacteria bacterium]
MNLKVKKITERILKRSSNSREIYLSRIRRDGENKARRGNLSCGNLAHGFAACNDSDKEKLKLLDAGNIAIVTAYNDMLSAHQPYETYPSIIKMAARDMGFTAQVAGGVPAMCDGVTQGQLGMELSLFSRDIIAQSTAIALSHQMFDGVVALGICDKIVPGLLMGALNFGYLPTIFVPAGPMRSGLENKEKQRVRQLHAEGKVSRKDLLSAESESYHSAGTCTFYGTANSNQVVLEALGLQLPGSSFVNPDDPMRELLTQYACHQLCRITSLGPDYRPIGEIIDEKSIVNALVAILASGGSTNHTMHLIAIALAAGIIINWDDISDLSSEIPLLARVYPNGEADINHFHAAGGTGFLFRQLLNAGYMHGSAKTVWGDNFFDYVTESFLENGLINWRESPKESLDENVVVPVKKAFSKEGGIKLLKGNLGRAIIKVSAVMHENLIVEAPAVVIDEQSQLLPMFEAGELDRDCVVVIRYQGPKANGMPELHKLTPYLGILQDRGHSVALVTDGRMSGASGKVPAAIHVSPEASEGGLISKVVNGDLIRVDAIAGTLDLSEEETSLMKREIIGPSISSDEGCGREFFAVCRQNVSQAEEGASFLFPGKNR